jgi:hypothetical protein
MHLPSDTQSRAKSSSPLAESVGVPTNRREEWSGEERRGEERGKRGGGEGIV